MFFLLKGISICTKVHRSKKDFHWWIWEERNCFQQQVFYVEEGRKNCLDGLDFLSGMYSSIGTDLALQILLPFCLLHSLPHNKFVVVVAWRFFVSGSVPKERLFSSQILIIFLHVLCRSIACNNWVLQPLLLPPGRSSGEFWSRRWAYIVFLFEISQNTKSDVHQALLLWSLRALCQNRLNSVCLGHAYSNVFSISILRLSFQ